MLRPLLPIVSDAWGHTFNEAIHIATVHAKYGANHLQSVMADNAAQHATGDKNQTTSKPAPAAPWHIPAKAATYSITQPTNKNRYTVLKCERIPGFISITAPPPKMANHNLQCNVMY